MPNWCENDLEITAYSDDKALEQLDEFMKAVRANPVKKEDSNFEEYHLLSAIVPMPEGEEDNWYKWSIENWGTKWDTEVSNIEHDDDRVFLSFMTAWSSPIAWLEKASQRYPLLQFKLRYDEPSMGFMGVTTASGGKMKDAFVEY